MICTAASGQVSGQSQAVGHQHRKAACLNAGATETGAPHAAKIGTLVAEALAMSASVGGGGAILQAVAAWTTETLVAAMTDAVAVGIASRADLHQV